QPVDPGLRRSFDGADGVTDERHLDEQQPRNGSEREDAVDHAPSLASQDHQRARDERDDDRRDDEMIGPGAHSSRSRPSTWSVPARPRSASSRTRKRAVVAKLMTIAVSTRACGTGSACCARSPATPRSSTGKAPARRPPVEKMKMLTA